MKPRLIYLIILLTKIPLFITAQNVSGQLVDEKHLPIPYANIALLTQSDSVFINGTVSDEQGRFSLDSKDIRSGIVRISSVGYSTIYKPLSTDLGTIVLTADTQLLQEIVIKGNLPITRVEGDALVTTIQNTVLSRAGSAKRVFEVNIRG